MQQKNIIDAPSHFDLRHEMPLGNKSVSIVWDNIESVYIVIYSDITTDSDTVEVSRSSSYGISLAVVSDFCAGFLEGSKEKNNKKRGVDNKKKID